MPKCMYKDENGILTETFIHKDPRITEIRFTASEYRAFINKYNSTLKKMTDAKAQLEKDLQNQIYLNQNLLRISRERANASRSLRQRKYTLDILCSQADSGSNIIPMIFHRKNTRQCRFL